MVIDDFVVTYSMRSFGWSMATSMAASCCCCALGPLRIVAKRSSLKPSDGVAELFGRKRHKVKTESK